jgi:hypothetical protein
MKILRPREVCTFHDEEWVEEFKTTIEPAMQEMIEQRADFDFDPDTAWNEDPNHPGVQFLDKDVYAEMLDYPDVPTRVQFKVYTAARFMDAALGNLKVNFDGYDEEAEKQRLIGLATRELGRIAW